MDNTTIVIIIVILLFVAAVGMAEDGGTRLGRPISAACCGVARQVIERACCIHPSVPAFVTSALYDARRHSQLG